MPADKAFDALKKGSGSQEIATTMAFVRLVKDLMRDKETGKRCVPVAPDEARTFGMESLFPSAGLYSPVGQTYDPVDRDQLLYYKEAKDGQILNDGITEAGSPPDFTAAATSYATHGEPMIPFYIFYSMFGWQRTADQFWRSPTSCAAASSRCHRRPYDHDRRGPPARGRPLAPDRLDQPGGVSYDPAYAYEIAHIVKDGLRRMYGRNAEDIFYYLTVYNETKVQPAMPEGVEEGILKGLYRFKEAGPAAADAPRLQLLASGTAIHWILEAQEILARDWGVAADVWSAPSWTELRRDALECDAARPEGEDRIPYVTRALAGVPGPGRGGQRLDAGRARPDRPVGRAGLDLHRHRRLRPLRHPRGRPPSLRRRRPVDRARRAHRAGQGGQGRPFAAEAGDRPLPAAGRRRRRGRRGGRRRVGAPVPTAARGATARRPRPERSGRGRRALLFRWFRPPPGCPVTDG
ncbi:hypothetical protein SRIMM317S_05999 [Streptomyces rimosus subsp. rimosus]